MNYFSIYFCLPSLQKSCIHFITSQQCGTITGVLFVGPVSFDKYFHFSPTYERPLQVLLNETVVDGNGVENTNCINLDFIERGYAIADHQDLNSPGIGIYYPLILFVFAFFCSFFALIINSYFYYFIFIIIILVSISKR